MGSLFTGAPPIRAEWSQEWRTELWYVLRECCSETSANPRSIREATRFCMGAYQDAIWFRRRSWQEQLLFARTRTSPSLCLLLLIGIFFLTWGIARISPRVAAGMSRIQVYPWLASDTGAAPCDCPVDLSAGQGRCKYAAAFRRLLALQDHAEAVWADDMPITEWTVAQARSDFFAVLHLPVRLTDGGTRLPNDYHALC